MIIKLTKTQLNEVKYIDAANRDMTSRMDRPYRKDWWEKYNQEPIKNNDRIRVFHGCSIETALDICQNGTSGKVYHPRSYSYENGMNPLGIFVTVNFEKAKDFGYDPKAMCILEFTVKASDLEAPVWNNSDSYFGQGSNPQPFRDAAERKKQKQKYDDEARIFPDETYWDYNKKKDVKLDRSYIRSSDKPAMAKSIFDNYEHQALFMGDLNPNMIKYVWVCENGQNQYQRYTEKDFLIKYNTDGNNKKKLRFCKDKLFLPNESVKSWDEVINRIVKRDEGSPWAMNKEEVINAFKEYNIMDNPNSSFALDYIKQIFWPRQIIQLYGRDFFNRNFNRLGQDFNESVIYDISTPLTEGSWGYKLEQNDGTLDEINRWYKQGFEMLAKSSEGIKKGDEAWHRLGLIFHIIKNIVDSNEREDDFEPMLMIKEYQLFKVCNKLLDICRNDEKWINSWAKPSKIKQSLTKVKKSIDKYEKTVDDKTD